MGKSGGGSGNWLMTYADFITLMMIFFIVLYTFTPGVEKSKFEAIIGAFQGKRGVLRFDSVFSDEMMNIDMQRAKNWDELYQKIQGNEGLKESVELYLTPEGIWIVLGEAALFETYSVELREESFDLLDTIAQGLNKYEFEKVDVIDVQGHTDNRPVVAASSRKYVSNWELGSGRALSVMNYLLKNSSLSPDKYSISSFGEFRPRVPNNSPEDMQKNRRVEILIIYKQAEIDPVILQSLQ